MTATPAETPIMSLKEGFGTLLVKGPNIEIEVREGGKDPLRVGDVMPDGSVYAGISPNTGRHMYTTPKDTGLRCNWEKAMAHAAKLDAHNHRDWRVPTKFELNVLFENRAAIGNFPNSDSDPAWYWSSSLHHHRQYGAWAQRFRLGTGNFDCFNDRAFSLRCVRG